MNIPKSLIGKCVQVLCDPRCITPSTYRGILNYDEEEGWIILSPWDQNHELNKETTCVLKPMYIDIAFMSAIQDIEYGTQTKVKDIS